MTNSSHNPEWPGDMDADARRLRVLQAKLAKIRAEDAAAAAFDPVKPTTGLGLGLKMGMDLTVATLIGFALGAIADWPLGTFPLLALILCGLGFAAGIRMVLASAKEYRERLAADQIPGSGGSNIR